MKTTIACTVLTLSALLAAPAFAQERAAGGPLENQMSWSALSTQIKTVDGKANAVNSRVDQIVVCGKQGKIYAPGASNADGNGCAHAALDQTTSTAITNATTSINNILTCNENGKVYNRSTNSCGDTTGSLRWSFSRPYEQVGKFWYRNLHAQGINPCPSADMSFMIAAHCEKPGLNCYTSKTTSRNTGSQGDTVAYDYVVNIYQCN